MLVGCDNIDISNGPTIKLNHDFETVYDVFSEEPNWIKAVTVEDSKGKSITVSSNDVEMDKVGSFEVDYEVKDSSGKAAIVSITIKIVDTTEPEINGLDDITVTEGSLLSDLITGVTVTDNYDGNIKLELGNVDTSNVILNQAGTYEVKYTVNDANGNVVSLTRTVIVVLPVNDISKIALITTNNTLDDRFYTQYTWEGVVRYAEEHNIVYDYYHPSERSTIGYINAIDLSVEDGVDVIVTTGFLFEQAIYEAQDLYPDVTFILLDGTPNNLNWNTDEGEFRIEDNVYSIFYAEHEAGFLAGYAVVKNGFRDLGFMGGIPVPAVILYGYGYLQGAEYAAQELGLAAGDVNVKYKYLDGFVPAPEYQTEASSWYATGTEVIFTVAGGVNYSVMRAAESATDKYVIGVDVDQSNDSETVIISTIKNLEESVYQCLSHYDNDSSVYNSGQYTMVDVTVGGINLSDNFSKLTHFTISDYNSIYNKMVNDTNDIRTDIISNNELEIKDLNLSLVSV